MKTEELQAIYAVLKVERANIEETWQAIVNVMMPHRGNFFTGPKSEAAVDWKRGRGIYDSTAPMAVQTLAASIHGSLTSPSTTWFTLNFRDADLKEDKAAKEWLDAAGREVYNALQDSNFNVEANEAYIDLVGMGTAVIIQEELSEKHREREGDFTFTAVLPEQMYFQQDHTGQIYRAFRKLSWTPLQIVDKFRAGVPKAIVEKATEPKQEKLEICMAVYRRENVDKHVTPPVAAALRPYGMKYFDVATGAQIGVEEGYYEMPAYAARWRKTADSQWGNSPAMLALADTLTLNALSQMTLQALEKVIDPATMATERGLLSSLDLNAGGLTIVQNKDSIWPYESKVKFADIQQEKGELRASIRSALFVDQLELKESPAMTATEVQARLELMQRLLGPTLGRLESDFLSPLILRSFNILLRAGRFGEVPPSLKGKSGAIDIKYVGPLARAQRKDEETAIIRWLGTLAEIAQSTGNPELMDIPDFDQIAKELAELGGVPADCLKAKEKVNTERKTREAAIQQQQQAEANLTQQQGNKAQAEASQIEQA